MKTQRRYYMTNGHPFIIASRYPGRHKLTIPLSNKGPVTILRRGLDDGTSELYISASRIETDISLN